MERISSLERKYVQNVLDNDFKSSSGSTYTKKLESLLTSH